jgi:hypothetical protein
LATLCWAPNDLKQAAAFDGKIAAETAIGRFMENDHFIDMTD